MMGSAPLEPDRLRLTRFSAAPKGVNQPLLIKLERVEVGAHASTSTYRALAARRSPILSGYVEEG